MLWTLRCAGPPLHGPLQAGRSAAGGAERAQHTSRQPLSCFSLALLLPHIRDASLLAALRCAPQVCGQLPAPRGLHQRQVILGCRPDCHRGQGGGEGGPAGNAGLTAHSVPACQPCWHAGQRVGRAGPTGVGTGPAAPSAVRLHTLREEQQKEGRRAPLPVIAVWAHPPRPAAPHALPATAAPPHSAHCTAPPPDPLPCARRARAGSSASRRAR